MDIMAWIADKTANHESSSLDDSKVKTILTGKSYVKEAKDASFITSKGEYEIPYSELYTASDTASDTPTIATLPAGTYTVGQEIVYTGTKFELLTNENANSGEHFFVVADDGNSVRLLAKYCLNREGTAQTDKETHQWEGDAGYGRPFSSTNYWSSDFTSSPFDLQGEYLEEHPLSLSETVANNAIKAAQAYGDSKGVEGRLMKKSEADAMVSSNSAIMYGKWNDGTQPDEGFLAWFLGAASSDDGSVWMVGGYDSCLYYDGYYSDLDGVRPILVVPES